MAQQTLDTTLNDDLGRQIAKLNAMLTELYAANTEFTDWSGTTVTATGLISGGTVTSTGLATVGTAKVDTGTKTATASAGAATLNKAAGVITSEGLTTAAAASYTLTLTNSAIAAADQVFVSVQNGTNTQGLLSVSKVTPAAGSVVIVVTNIHASEALNGTIKISFVSFKN